MTDDEIWRIIRKHYTGNPDSLLALKIFEVAKEVNDQAESEYYDLYTQKIIDQTDEIRYLKGLPPVARA